MTYFKQLLIGVSIVFLILLGVGCSGGGGSGGGNEGDSGTGDGDSDADGDADGDTDIDVDPDSSMGPGTNHPYEPESGNSDAVETNDDGWLVLKTGLEGDRNNLWVSNSDEGTVSNVDTELIKEVGRYHSGLADGADPSRTSVDLAGDVFIGNRAEGSVTKIAGSTARCIDRNGNSTIETSDGPALIYPRAGAGGVNGVPEGQSTDECVLWTKTLADVGIGCDGPRAVAATAETGDDFEYNGHVWIGCRDSDTIFKLNGKTGDVLVSYGPFDGTGGLVNLSPYGFVLDKAEKNRLWIAGKGGSGDPGVYAMDTTNGMVSLAVDNAGFSPEPYGIALDDNSHVWITSNQAGEVWRFEPVTETWKGLLIADVKFKGIAADRYGFIWPIVHSDDAAVYGIDAATFPSTTSVSQAYLLADDNNTPVKGGGVAIDFSGHVWGVSGSGCGTGEKTGCASRLVVDRSAALPSITAVPDNVKVGEGTYVYSDMIGYSLLNFTSKEGWYRQTFDVCEDHSTKWKQIVFQSKTPGGTRFVIRARAADSMADLQTAAWHTIVKVPPDVSPVDLPADLPEGHFIELEVRLYTTTNGVTPAVGTIGFTYECTGEIVIV